MSVSGLLARALGATLLAAAAATPSFSQLTSPPVPSAPGAEPDRRVVLDVRRGDWQLVIDQVRTSRPGAHAPRHGYRVLRRREGEEEAKVLWEEATTGRVHAFLREDGLVFLDPVGDSTRFILPDGRVLPYPLPGFATDVEPHGYTDLSVNAGGRVHFLEDLVLVTRSAGIGRAQIAWLKVDLARAEIGPYHRILEVENPADQRDGRCAMVDGPVLHVKKRLVWVNEGFRSDYKYDEVDPEWRDRRLRVWDLEAARFVDPTALDEKCLAGAEGPVIAFLGAKDDRRVDPEFALWALPRLGRTADRKHFPALARLLAELPGYSTVWEGGRSVDATKRLRSAYLEALAAINAR
ncbi:MAG: hypothetical protein R3F20_02980 [Planctomycetota bacterium]